MKIICITGATSGVGKKTRLAEMLLEGNHALNALNPDFAVMVLSRDGKFKKSALEIKDRIDLFVKNVNSRQADAMLERVSDK